MKTIMIIIFLLVSIFLSSCGVEKRNNFILLLDISESIKEERWNQYLEIIENTIVPNLKRYDRLTVQFIDECVLTKAERVFFVELDKMDFTNKLDGLNNMEDSIKARLHRYLVYSVKPQIIKEIQSKREQRKDCGNFTDIINSLNESVSLLTCEKSYTSIVDKVLNSAQGLDNYKYENVLIIFSDMIQESRDKKLDFTKLGKIDEGQVNEKIKLVHDLNKIPDLNGSTMFIYGATSSSNAGFSSNMQIQNCRLFWRKYFFDSNAKLIAYSFDCEKEIYTFLMN